MSKAHHNAILLISCPDTRGIVTAITQFILDHSGNILDLDQHVDRRTQTFFMRVSWDLEGFALNRDQIRPAFEPLAQEFAMAWQLHFSQDIPRMAILVSNHPHCLYDLLSRYQSGEWRVEVPVVISNHDKLAGVARSFGVNFHHLPINAQNKAAQEEKIKTLLDDYQVEFMVLARYMQILSQDFLKQYPSRVINIHHSFLPAFPGAKPYHSAHARGVKIIGATSHYVTEELDAGPIIEQDVARVSHKESVGDYIRKGRDLEKVVLARAVHHHLQRRILLHDNRTVIF